MELQGSSPMQAKCKVRGCTQGKTPFVFLLVVSIKGKFAKDRQKVHENESKNAIKRNATCSSEKHSTQKNIDFSVNINKSIPLRLNSDNMHSRKLLSPQEGLVTQPLQKASVSYLPRTVHKQLTEYIFHIRNNAFCAVFSGLNAKISKISCFKWTNDQ